MVYRVFVEKKPELAFESEALLQELCLYAGLHSLKSLRVVNRYDAEGLTGEDFEDAVRTVFSEPQTDFVSGQLAVREGERAFALEYLPGQFDQRADSAAQCIQMRTMKERPLVRSARVYLLSGPLGERELEQAKAYLLNPVEAREASMALPSTLAQAVQEPEPPAIVNGFRRMDEAALQALLVLEGLAMDLDDLRVCQRYFRQEGREPSLMELKVIDTYWSDHCRHTTFFTEIKEVRCGDPYISKTLAYYHETRASMGRSKPFTLMDVATLAARTLHARGQLKGYEPTEENNACTIRVKADTAGGEEDWLLFFKNETHNHPSEIEPFGGAATCIGGAIRDPLSARAYVYAGMRVSGAADPRAPLEATLPGKLPQRQIVQGAAAGFSSYGNQIGVPTGCVREIYHKGFAAKRLEAGAVLGAAPYAHVRRERPAPGDVVLLVGGRTGRDGCGGATGSSMAHTAESVDVCAAQVQKGNAPEERKLQRLFRDPAVSRLIKRCNDFGAGGVSVAIGELAPGLDINLDAVPVKYEGLSALELAISESQERMAVVVEQKDADAFIHFAGLENLEATPVAVVTGDKRLVMRWRGQTVLDLSRAFLDENGARKETAVEIEAPRYAPQTGGPGFAKRLLSQAEDLNLCSQRGLVERFDSTVGSATVLLPLGGKHQASLPQAMVHTLPVREGTDTCSFMSFGYNPFISAQSPYHGAYLAVVESLARLAASGADTSGAYLSLQEFFPKPGRDSRRWGLPLAAVLGAFRAQMELGVAAIGGKDSMSGTFERLDVPPTLISFAVATGSRQQVVSPEFKKTGSRLVWLKPDCGPDLLPQAASLKAVWARAREMMSRGQVLSCAAPGYGGLAAALMNMALGNGIGAELDENFTAADLFADAYGSLVLEVTADCEEGPTLGYTAKDPSIRLGAEAVSLEAYERRSGQTLEAIFPTQAGEGSRPAPPARSLPGRAKGPAVARPRVLIPAFPGTNCEEDTARAFSLAGAVPEVFVLRNRTPGEVAQTVRAFARALRDAQMLLIPGGFSFGDEPDGSGKFIAAFLRSGPVRDGVMELLNARRGLVGGICNGFQALVKVGLLPNGEISDVDGASPTLTRNRILRHQSALVQVRVASALSPWFAGYQVGEVRTIPVSHGEGRFLCGREQFEALSARGQIAAQYCDGQGNPALGIAHNPAGSAFAVEALTSPDGRVMGRMGHSERMLSGLYKNVPNTGHDPLFDAAVAYFV